MPLRCIVVDDEPLAKILLEKYVGLTPGLELVGSYTHASEAYAAIKSGQVQLAFLDIRMPGMSGLQIAKDAHQVGCRVVFTTAFREYALDGFRVNALDYLLKPISYEEFSAAANRALDAIKPPTHITIRENYRNTIIEINDIIYIEGLRDYVKIHLADSRSLLTQMTMKTAESMLPATDFARIHRSFIVAVARVKSFTRNTLTIELPFENDTAELPIGDTYRATFNNLMAAR